MKRRTILGLGLSVVSAPLLARPTVFPPLTGAQWSVIAAVLTQPIAPRTDSTIVRMLAPNGLPSQFHDALAMYLAQKKVILGPHMHTEISARILVNRLPAGKYFGVFERIGAGVHLFKNPQGGAEVEFNIQDQGWYELTVSLRSSSVHPSIMQSAVFYVQTVS